MSEECLGKLMKSLAVMKVATGVQRVELMSLHKENEKEVKRFAIVFAAKQKLIISLWVLVWKDEWAGGDLE